MVIDNDKTFCFDFLEKREIRDVAKKVRFLIQINRTTNKNEDQENCEIINRVARRVQKSKMYQKTNF